jgi:hypothetical protein
MVVAGISIRAGCLEEQSAFVVAYVFSERDYLQKSWSDHQDSRGRGVRDSSKMLKNHRELEVRQGTLEELVKSLQRKAFAPLNP